jgi:hypothetical protein
VKGARVIRVSPPDPSPGAVEAAVETLQAGGIVTIYITLSLLYFIIQMVYSIVIS